MTVKGVKREIGVWSWQDARPVPPPLQNKAVLVLHHTDKDSRNYRGHSEVARAIDNVLIAVKDKNASNAHKTVVNVRKPKSRHGANNEDLLAFEFGVNNYTQFYFKKLH